MSKTPDPKPEIKPQAYGVIGPFRIRKTNHCALFDHSLCSGLTTDRVADQPFFEPSLGITTIYGKCFCSCHDRITPSGCIDLSFEGMILLLSTMPETEQGAALRGDLPIPQFGCIARLSGDRFRLFGETGRTPAGLKFSLIMLLIETDPDLSTLNELFPFLDYLVESLPVESFADWSLAAVRNQFLKTEEGDKFTANAYQLFRQ